MNKRIKELWVNALQSKEYKQGRRRLYDSEVNPPQYCCLGVLTALYLKERDGDISELDWMSLEYPDLPDEVADWAGLNSHNPILDEKGNCASALNDNGATFEEIAELIQLNL